MNKSVKLLVCAVGIFVCYFYYGILQERITRGKYGEGENAEKFTFATSIVFVQCIVNAIYAKLVLLFFTKHEDDSTKISYYAMCSFSYLVAMVSSNKALQWVNYPTQVVGKSCKPIPVMVLGVLFGRKSYSLKKYFFVFMIVIGVCLFMYKDSGSAAVSNESIFGFGEILLILSLTMDGMTGAVQERMKAEHQTKSGHMMLKMNVFGVLYTALALVITGELFEFLQFVNRHPSIVWNILIFSIASALGQFFIFLSVADFGPLVCSIITTTRKFFTVLGSVFLFGNTLINRQWIGTLFVFTGLILDSLYGKSVKKPLSATK